MVVHNQRITGEGDDTLSLHPLLIRDARIAEYRIGEIRNSSLCDEPDLEVPNGNA